MISPQKISVKKATRLRGLEYLYYQKELYAIILRKGFTGDSVCFFTPDNYSQQLGYLPHKKNDSIKAHFHKPGKREAHPTQETLFVKKGRVKVNFYGRDKKHLGSEIISSGDIILLCAGAHGFEILRDSVMIEVKQGPYSSATDKETFKGIE